MTIITEGYVVETVLLFGIIILAYYFYSRSKVNPPELRRLAPIDAIEEVIGRCTEMGKPLFVTAGRGSLSTSGAPATIAGLNVLAYVTSLAAKTKTKIITVAGAPDFIPMMTDVMRTQYTAAGAFEDFDPGCVRYYGHIPTITPFQSGCCMVVSHEHVGGIIQVGFYECECGVIAEAAAREGAISVGGTDNIAGGALPFMVVASDYSLIAEEIHAASAYLSKDPALMGSIVAQDVYRILIALIIFIGFILTALGIPGIVELLTY